MWVPPANRKRRQGFRRSRIPPRRAHDTLRPQDESIIVGYYTSAEVFSKNATPYHKPKLQEEMPMARGDGINRTSARNMRMTTDKATCALPGFVDSKNEEKTERNAGYLVVSHSGGGMLRQGTRKGIRRTPANRGMRAHRIVKSLDISEDVCHGLCP